jgi:hypothetical protein
MNPTARNAPQHMDDQMRSDSNLEIPEDPITKRNNKNKENRLGTLESLISRTINGTNEIARKKNPVVLKNENQRSSPAKKKIISLFRREMTAHVKVNTISATITDHLSAFLMVALACNEPKLCLLRLGVKR